MSVIIVVLPKIENAKKIAKILQTHRFQNVLACSSAALALQADNWKMTAGLSSAVII